MTPAADAKVCALSVIPLEELAAVCATLKNPVKVDGLVLPKTAPPELVLATVPDPASNPLNLILPPDAAERVRVLPLATFTLLLMSGLLKLRRWANVPPVFVT